MLTNKFKLLLLNRSLFKQFIKKYSNEKFAHYDVFRKHFQFTESETKQFVERENLIKFDPEVLNKTILYCKEIGFDNSSILLNPMLLRCNPLLIENRYNVMNEGGLKVTPYTISKFRTFYLKKIILLKQLNLMNTNADLTQNFIKYLDVVPESLQDYKTNDNSTWTEIHLLVLRKYLITRLQMTEEEYDNFERVHVGIHRKSFRLLVENIQFAEQLDFSPDKIVKYGYILINHPKYPKALLEKFPTLAGLDTKRAMRMYPKLINVSPEKVERIFKILKEYNISDAAIQKRTNIFHLAPETVKARLEEVAADKNMNLLMHSPNILKIIVHHNRAKSRLPFLKKLQLKCTGIPLLGNDAERFDIRVKDGRDVNSQTDLFAFLSNLMQLPIAAFETSLKMHRNYAYVPLLSIETTYNTLINQKFSPSEIAQVATILLYPAENVYTAYKQTVAYLKGRKASISQVKKLNLMLYFMEKEYHFTGNGIWVRVKEDEAVKAQI